MLNHTPLDPPEHLFTRIIQYAGISTRLMARIRELAKHIAETSNDLPTHKFNSLVDCGTKISLLGEELAETNLILNSDFVSVIESESDMNKRYLQLYMEYEALKYKLSQLEKK